MPTVDANKQAWDAVYQWPNRGDEWSARGGAFHAVVRYHLAQNPSLSSGSEHPGDRVRLWPLDAVSQGHVPQVCGHRSFWTDGAAFIHPSNLGEYDRDYSRIRRIPRLEGLHEQLGILDKTLHWRDSGVSAAMVDQMAEAHGLKCISQEVIPWGTKRAYIDCFSTIVKETSPAARQNRLLRNADWLHEVDYLAQLAQLYATGV